VNILPPTLELSLRHRPAGGKPNQKYTDPDQVYDDRDDNGN
jgi:hypothetical protein